MAEVLSTVEITSRVADLDGWTSDGASLHRELEFANFSEAFGFMARVALIAEKLDHHPDWSNSWNKVTIDIASHDAGGITEQCFTFAERVNKVLAA